MVRKDILLLTTRTSRLCHGPGAGRGCGTSPLTCAWQPSDRNASPQECQSCWLQCWGVREGELLLAVPEPRKSAPHCTSVRCDPKSPLDASPASGPPTTEILMLRKGVPTQTPAESRFQTSLTSSSCSGLTCASVFCPGEKP